MKILRIKDNSRTQKSEFANIPTLSAKIENKTLEQLEREGVFVFPEVIRDADDLSADQMILQSVNDSFLTGNVVGFLGCGNERLNIASRFSEGDKDYFFQYLLQKVLEFPNFVSFQTDVNSSDRIFDLLMFLFPHYLRIAMRKGIFKTYIRREYNDSNVKGTVDIARHIARNTPFTGRIAYSQREYSYDNYLTELIRHTIESMKRKPYGMQILSKVKDQVQEIISVTQKYEICDRSRIISENRQNTVRHAYYHEYRALQHLCLLILQHQKHQVGTGSKQIYGILFDAAWLWEEYLNSLISVVFYHPMNKSGKEGQHLFAGNRGLIYPDFISRDADNRIIADAKYKPVWNIGNRDYLQLLAYMLRFDAKQGYYLYPETLGMTDLTFQVNKGSTYENDVSPRSDLSVIKHGLKIPCSTTTYGQFVAQIQASETEFKEVFYRNK